MSDEAAITWHERNANTAAEEAYIAIIDGRVCVVEKVGDAWDIKLDGKPLEVVFSRELILKAVGDYFRERN